MKRIKELVEQIDDELCGAETYAEEYIYLKAKGDTTWANRYKEMANDELKHLNYIHEKAMKEIEMLSKVYTAPPEMQKKWDESHAKYLEKSVWIKSILNK